MASVFCGALALFWSVDESFIYFFAAGAIFCFFKMFQSRVRREGTREEYTYQEARTSVDTSASAPLFDRLLTFIEENRISKQRIILIGIAGFFGFFFFIMVVGVLFDSASSRDLTYENTLRASDFYSQGQYDSAAYYYRLALLDDPQNPDLWLNRGNSFLNNGMPDSAMAMYEKTLEYKPDSEDARYNIAIIYYNRKSYRDAIQVTKEVLQYNPDYLDGKLLIGDCFYNQSQLDSALQWYEQAYETGYRSAVLCHLMAYIYDVKEKPSVAISLYKEAIGQDSSIVEIYSRLGELIQGDEGNWYRQKAIAMQNQNSN